MATTNPIIPGNAFSALSNSIAKMFGLPTYSQGTNAFFGARLGGTPTRTTTQLQSQPQTPPQSPQQPPQFDPAAAFNQRAPGVLPALNTSGVNQFLSDPLMANYYGTQNPLYANQQQLDFYGDPELFRAPSAN